MFFDGLTIEKYGKTKTFLDFRSFKKTMKERSKKSFQKSSKSDPKRSLGRQGSIYSSILSCLRQHSRPGPSKVGVPTVEILE